MTKFETLADELGVDEYEDDEEFSTIDLSDDLETTEGFYVGDADHLPSFGDDEDIESLEAGEGLYYGDSDFRATFGAECDAHMQAHRRIYAPKEDVFGFATTRILKGAVTGAIGGLVGEMLFAGDEDFGGETIPNKLTPLDADQAAQAISAAYERIEGSKPKPKILRLLLGQWALETGNGKFIHNFNYGNVKATANTPLVQYFRCSEILDGREQFFDPPDPHCAFAAYRNADDGAEAFIKTLKHRPNWWNGLQTGTAEGFVEGLSTQPMAYFTANPDKYRDVLVERADNYDDVAKKYGKALTLLAIGEAVVTGVAVAVFGRKLLSRTA
jgi:hypothetical protein